MDRIIDRADLADQLDAALAEVGAGGSVLVTQGGRTVAQIVPVIDGPDAIDRQAEVMAAAYERIRALPRIEGGPWRRADLYEP